MPCLWKAELSGVCDTSYSFVRLSLMVAMVRCKFWDFIKKQDAEDDEACRVSVLKGVTQVKLGARRSP